MRDYEQRIARLKSQLAELTQQLAQLEDEFSAYLEQRERRKAYLSSRQVLDLIEACHGRNGSMATIKRWADSGYLGEVVDERELFPLLEGKQGNKRFLYPRETVCRFLYEKGLLRPAFDILDRVCVSTPAGCIRGLVTSFDRRDDRFTYQVQLEETGVVLADVSESELSLP